MHPSIDVVKEDEEKEEDEEMFTTDALMFTVEDINEIFGMVELSLTIG